MDFTTSNFWKRHNFEGQNKKNKLHSFHLDAQKHSNFMNEYSLTECLKKISTGLENSHEINDEIYEKIRQFKPGRAKFSTLKQLFLKFLHLRSPSLSPIAGDCLSFTVGCFTSMLGGKREDFNAQNLWKQMENNLIIKAPNQAIFDSILHFMISNGIYGKYSELATISKSHFSLFGEFLFHVSRLNKDSESPMALIRMEATEEEHRLLDELVVTITPKLGILTYIKFRNCATSLNNKTVQNIYESYHDFRIVHPSIYDSYKSNVIMIAQFPVLASFYTKFIKFLATEIHQSSMRFGVYFLRTDLIGGVVAARTVSEKDYKDNLGLLIFVLRYVTDIIIYLHKKNSNFDFTSIKEMPSYLKSFEMPETMNINDGKLFHLNGRYESAWSMIMSMSLLMDFIFIGNWQEDILNDYLLMCKEINFILDGQLNTIKHLATESSLFPFV